MADLFKVYFPNLQRRSALITLYSFLEIELIKLCNSFKNSRKLKLNVTDLNRKEGEIKRSVDYLIKVVGLDFDYGKDVWSEIDTIRKIRNKIVHHDGRIDNEKDTALVKYIVDSPYLFGEKEKEYLISEVIIKDGFLNYVLTEFYESFDEINKSIPK